MKTSDLQSFVDRMKYGQEEARWKALRNVKLSITEGIDEELNEKTRKVFNYLSTDRPKNKTFLKLLREALLSPGYQALKEDPDISTVISLQHLALAIWNNVDTLDTHTELGTKILEDKSFENTSAITGSCVVGSLAASHEAACHYLNKDQTLLDKLKFLISDEGWIGRMASRIGFNPPESQTAVIHFPVVQGTTVYEMGDSEGRVKNCYGGVSTLGGEVSPEFLAAIQMIENNRKCDVQDPSIPQAILYINFQNIGKKEGENSRSVALMELNQYFPDSFLGITLSRDSRFYMNTDNRGWRGSEAFGTEMKRYLMSGSSYSLHGRTEQDDGGLYFPGNHQDWEKIFDLIIAKANAHFKEVPPILKLHAQQSELRGAYQEYVYSMLQNVLEALLLNRCKASNPMILSIRAGKENLERCDNENVKNLYMWLGDNYFRDKDGEGLKLLTGAFHTPSLVFCNCLPNIDRTRQIFSFIEYVDRKGFQEDRKELLSNYGVKDAAYRT